MHTFQAELKIIDINPYVEVPDRILSAVLKQAGKDKGKIPIRGTINETPYQQTLVRFRGEWRLYVNTKMLPRSPQKIGIRITVTIEFDPSIRTILPHPKWEAALAENKAAKAIFDQLRPSLQLEIVRYITNLKTEASIEKNVAKAIGFLLGKERFVGRDHP
ncbi:protein of unknown function [Filimonas lacunae]|uniref:Bacteriocin-protection, YdeI or OmpD-Associated n=1 Tax=Filimonas lacunae TaxID=477680 RepID=A0A173MQB0_9BACT|nr:YdeI/OmpD-associated family protein [Filimonas lacunae]BAV09677.1 hypothetical protein FLA_5730 [Filimonas lacunae]SIS77094.1 protein of unknown function [Filimonas lacunae]